MKRKNNSNRKKKSKVANVENKEGEVDLTSDEEVSKVIMEDIIIAKDAQLEESRREKEELKKRARDMSMKLNEMDELKMQINGLIEMHKVLEKRLKESEVENEDLRKKCRQAEDGRITVQIAPEVKTSSRYEGLEIEEMDESEENEVNESGENEVNNKKRFNQKKEKQIKKRIVTEEEFPPIEVRKPKKMSFEFTKFEAKKVSTALEGRNIKPEYDRRGGRVKLIYDDDKKDDVMEILKETEAEGHTYKTKNEKVVIKVLSSVDSTYTIE